MKPNYIEKIEGYKDCKDLIRGSWVCNNCIWGYRYFPTKTEFEIIEYTFSLTMVDDPFAPKSDGIEIMCHVPVVSKIPSRMQIIGLQIEFVELRKSSGLENDLWKLTDFENDDISISCQKISLCRVGLVELYKSI